jgi:hypothetical protein
MQCHNADGKKAHLLDTHGRSAMKAPLMVAGLVAGIVCGGCGQPVSPAGPSTVATGSLSLSSTSARSVVPFRGSLEGTQTVTPLEPPLLLVQGQATGTATHLGRFTLQFPHTVNLATASGEGTYTFTAANGDTLEADVTGAAQVGPITSIVEDAVITGGTGRFAGATGTFSVRRLFDSSNGTTTGSFEGTISTPGAGR